MLTVVPLALTLLTLVVLAARAAARTSIRGRPACFLMIVGAAGYLSGAAAARPIAASALADHPSGPGAIWKVRGRLAGDPQRMSSSSWSVELAVDGILVDGTWRNWPLRVRASVYDPVDETRWRSGDGFEAFLGLRNDRPSRNPLVRPRPPLRASGADVRASLKSFRQFRERPRGGFRPPGLGAARSWLRDRINARFGHTAPLVKALLLGERGEVPDDAVAVLARTGLIHLVAISGLHVSIVLTALFGFLRAAGLPRPRAATLCIASLPLIYGIVVPRPPVARACVMAAVVLVAVARGRRSAPLNGLAAATLALTTADPWVVRNGGFQLSTAATGAILLLCRVPRERSGPRGALGALTGVSLAAGMGIAPLLAASTHRLTPISLLLNPIAVPALGIALVGAMTVLTADAMGAARLADGLAAAVTAVLDALLWLSAAVDRRVPALVVPAPAVPWVLPSVLGIGGAILLWRTAGNLELRRRVAARISAAAICGVVGVGFAGALGRPAAPPLEAFRLVAFDIGQGDALLLETPGATLMVDTGGSPIGTFDPGTALLAPALRARGTRRLDAVAITHLHADHAGGLAGLLSEIPTRAVWVPSFAPDSPAGLRLRADAGDAALVSLAAHHRTRQAACDWRALHPPAAAAPAGGAAVANDGSLVLSLDCGGRTLLLTGDTEKPAETIYVGHLDRRADVLKSAHHGSNTSSSPALLDAGVGRHAVISAGWRNRFGHPDAGVLERYRSRQIAVYRTDRDGAVTVSAGARIRVRAERWSAGRGRYRVGGWLSY